MGLHCPCVFDLGATIVAPLPHVMWRRESRGLSVIQASLWPPMKVNTPILAQLCHVQTLPDLHLILVSLPLLPLPCQCKGDSLFINNIKVNNNCLSLLSACRLWVLVTMEVLQMLIVIYNTRSAFTPAQDLLYLRITGFFKISSPPICWRKSRGGNMSLLCSFPDWPF